MILAGLHLQLPFNVIVLGLLTGLVYALLGVGITVTYRTSRVFNMAIGQMGALAAMFVPVLVIEAGFPYLAALFVALMVAAATGAFTDRLVIRTLANSSRLVNLVATLALAQVFFVAELFLPVGGLGSHLYPVPFHLSLSVGSLRLGSGYILMLIVVPITVAATTLFFRRTTLGLASRAAAENRDAASLVGIPVRRVSLIVWTLSGLLAGLAAILNGPSELIGSTPALIGPTLLLRALTAAFAGGLGSLPQVFGAGVAIGIVEAVIRFNYPAGGTVDVVMLVIILLSLLARPEFRRQVRSTAASAWSLTGRETGLPAWVLNAPRVRVVRRLGPATLATAAALIPVGMTNGGRVEAATIAVFALMGLSIVVLVGLAGQVSLAQFTFVELGAFVAGRLAQEAYPLWVALSYVLAAGAVAALVIGLPALRVKGEYLAVTTLGFAVAGQTWLPQQGWLVNATSQRLNRPHWFGIDWSGELRYYWLCLAVLLIGVALVVRIRGSGLGRRFIAVRDNELAAASLGVSPRQVKLLVFVLAGALAAGAGFFYGGLLGGFSDPTLWTPVLSFTLISYVVLGGVTTAAGAVLGAFAIYGSGYYIQPLLAHHIDANAEVILSGVGLLAVILTNPNGLMDPILERHRRIYLRLAGPPPEDAPAGNRPRLEPRPASPEPAETAEPAPVIACHDVRVQYGGNVVLDGVSLHAGRGEIVGLVGPNGAGKTTLFDVLSGQQAPASGRVELGGADVTRLPPAERARRGMARTFQQAKLFEGLSVLDCVKLALECASPTETVPALLGLPPARAEERHKTSRAREIVALMGLGPYSHLHVPELSTGMRRLLEIATAVAVEPRVLLLDEPTAGIAQREVEAFGRVLKEVQAHLAATVVLIEHDLPLVTSLCDRMYVLATGSVIAEGRPGEVRDEPAVIAAYLGTDERVIARSGAAAPHGRRSATRAVAAAVDPDIPPEVSLEV